MLLVYACANVGMPTGGEKDVTPPKVVRSNPENNALNFNGEEVVIEFDELIQLKDVRQKFVISPPMNEQPTVEARANRLVITFLEELQPNSTYSLDFADAIVDNNEGNVLENFSFSFSTGTYIDSLQVSGNVWTSDDLSPAEGVLVLLHKNLNDTAVQKLVPIRMAKTNATGRFSILNVSPGEYRVFALEDANRNFKFDQPGEQMAWSDVIVEPGFEYRERADTIYTDSLTVDSIAYSNELVYLPDSMKLLLFQHDYKRQYLVSEERKEKARLTFFFNRPQEQNATIVLTGNDAAKDVFLTERSLKNDTVSFWLKDTTYYQMDSLSITLGYQMLDSLDQPFIKRDTIAMYHFEVKEKKKKKKDDEPEPIPMLSLKDVKSKVDVYGRFRFSLSAPAVRFDKSAVRFYQYEDTVPKPIKLMLEQDSMLIRNYSVSHKWEPGATYEMQIDSATIYDVYGIHNGPIKMKFSVKKLEEYSTVYLKIANVQPNWLIQVIDKNEKVVQQNKVPASGKVGFRYLYPGMYMFRIVEDSNGNGLWDNGNFYERIQPEKLIYFPGKVTIRANWVHDLEEWNPIGFSEDEFSRQYRKPKKKDK